MYTSHSFRRLALGAAVFLSAVPLAAAQSSSSSGGGSSMGGGSTGGGGSSTSSMGGSSGSGNSSSSANSGQASAPAARTQQQGFTGGIQQGFIQTTTTGGGNVGGSGSGFNANSSSSPVATTYANPLYSGKPGASSQTGVRVGGFGSNLYTWNAPNQQNVLGRVSNTQQGQNANHNNMNVSTTPGRRVAAYTSALKFRHPTLTPVQVHAQARATIASTTSLPSAQRIQVMLDGSTIVLRGKVGDDDERRLAENVLRLTPGVRDIRNELAVDGSASAASSQAP